MSINIKARFLFLIDGVIQLGLRINPVQTRSHFFMPRKLIISKSRCIYLQAKEYKYVKTDGAGKFFFQANINSMNIIQFYD